MFFEHICHMQHERSQLSERLHIGTDSHFRELPRCFVIDGSILSISMESHTSNIAMSTRIAGLSSGLLAGSYAWLRDC